MCEHHRVGRDPERVGHSLENALLQPLTHRRCGFPRLGHHDEPFGAEPGVGHPEHRDTALPDTLDRRHDRLGLVRVDVAAALDDDILAAAGQKQLRVGQVAEVAGIDPAVVGRDRPRCGLVPVIAGHHRRTAELDTALRALGEGGAGVVHDPDMVPRERPATRHEGEGVGVGGRHRLPRLLEPAGHPVHARRVPARREGEADRALGQSVDRPHRVGTEPGGTEPIGKAGQGLRQHGF